MAEQLICNQQVGGSSPFAGSSGFKRVLVRKPADGVYSLELAAGRVLAFAEPDTTEADIKLRNIPLA